MLWIWSYILTASVAIGLFLLALLLSGRKSNPTATYLFSAIVLILVASNADNWLHASGVWREYPMPSGFSRASILLLGPLIYLYARSVISQTFTLRPVQLLHVVPYLVAFGTVFPYLFLHGSEEKLEFLRYTFEEEGALYPLFSIILIGYLIHLATYLILTIGVIRTEMREENGVSFIVPTRERLKWLRKLSIAYAICLLVIIIVFTYALATGHYRPELNFYITSSYTLLICYLGVQIVRSEQLILPDFSRKYQTINVSEEQKAAHLAKLKELFETERIYLDPDITLALVAQKIGIPPGYLSKLLGEEHGKNFPEFINLHRVREVQNRLNDPQYASLSILGIATEVGFSSKSAFNAAFKKIVGMPPSEYKSR